MARPRKHSIYLPPHVKRVTVKGKPYCYLEKFRGTDKAEPRIRLGNDPRDPDWWAEYARLMKLPAKKPKTNTFTVLIDQWQASPEWSGMAKSTKTDWSRYCERVRSAWGGLEVAGVEPKHAMALRDTFAATPRAADEMITCLSRMMTWSILLGWRTENPCSIIPKLASSQEYAPWCWTTIGAAQRQLIHKGRSDLWRACALALYTGQRMGDVLTMLRTFVRSGQVAVRQEKTDQLLWLPMYRDLMPIVENVDHDATTLLVSSHGRPWTKDGFKTAWGRHRPALVKRQGLVFHGLRKSAVVTLLEAGCTVPEVSAVTGQSYAMVEHYAKEVNQRKLARTAMARWENA